MGFFSGEIIFLWFDFFVFFNNIVLKNRFFLLNGLFFE